MENFLNQMEDQTRSLKDPWELDGVSTFDSEALLAAIMIKGGQMEPLFADPRFFYNMNNMWWRKWIPTFKYWWTASEKEYNPLWDREGFEEITDHTEESGTLDSSTTGIEVIDTDTTGKEITDEDTTGSLTGKEIVDDNTTSSSTTASTASTENRVSAYDASTYQPSSSSSSSSNVTESASSADDKITDTTEHTTGVLDKTVNTTGTADTTRNTTGAIDTDTTGSKDSTHSSRTWGNWGISTTSQKLLYSEYEVRFKLNPYELMSDIFLNEMSVRVF